MKRYLAFGSDQPKAHAEDFLGDYDDLVTAKAKVEASDADGYTEHMIGHVIDTQTGQIYPWESDGTAFGRLAWKPPHYATPRR